ncbi:MAG: hypothetical protein ACLQGP_04155 [Isosphaeraceae bacterium]
MDTGAMTSAPAFFGRLSWMIVGPFALAICAFTITERHDGWFSPVDLTYFLVLGGMALGRWTEFQSGQPLTATGEPATPAHLRRYLLGLSTLGLGIWIAANVLGNAAIHFMG